MAMRSPARTPRSPVRTPIRTGNGPNSGRKERRHRPRASRLFVVGFFSFLFGLSLEALLLLHSNEGYKLPEMPVLPINQDGGSRNLASSPRQRNQGKLRDANGDKESESVVPCLWTDLTVASDDSKALVVTSSHPTSDGTSFILLGDSSIDVSRRTVRQVVEVTCDGNVKTRDLILSDPSGTNKFNIHRIDCPLGVPLRFGERTCPALPKQDAADNKWKAVICLAPVYANSDNTRWLIEWLLYHQSIGFDHVVVPNFDLEGDSLEVLKEFEKSGFVRIVPWSTRDTNGWIKSNRVYEHGKLPAWNRCYLEYYDKADWMLFMDFDEVLEVKTSLADTIQWMSNPSRNDKLGFSLENRAMLSVLDKPKSEELLFAQYSAKERQPLCPYNCGTFHKGRWKYFVRGGKLMNELLWTHSIQGLDYDRATELMGLIPEDSVASVRHYQAHWYVWHFENKNMSSSEFSTTRAAIESDVLEQIQSHIDANFKEIYGRSKPGLSWATPKKPLPIEVIETIRNQVPNGSIVRPKPCTSEQAQKLVDTFVGNTEGNDLSRKINAISACHHSSWIRDYYETKDWSLQAESPFLAISVGCNKGYDAVDIARMLSRNPVFDKNKWKQGIDQKVKGGLEFRRAYCGADRAPSFNVDGGDRLRTGEFHCIEPMPATFGLVSNLSSEIGLAEHNFIVTQAALSNISGTLQFPDQLPAGEEGASIFMCNEDEYKEKCTDVPVYRLDEFVSKFVGPHGQDHAIDMLMIDAEGFDLDILTGGKETLKRVQYLEFEYHKVGSWKDQSLLDAISLLQDDFTCYWAGQSKLWRITGCTSMSPANKLYEPHQWSNVACVNLQQTELADIMETTFLNTIKG